jgi:hypothetical protein
MKRGIALIITALVSTTLFSQESGWLISPFGSIAASKHVYEKSSTDPALALSFGLSAGKSYKNLFMTAGAGFLQTGGKVEDLKMQETYLIIPITVGYKLNPFFVQVSGIPAYTLSGQLAREINGFTDHQDYTSQILKWNFIVGLAGGLNIVISQGVELQLGVDAKYFTSSVSKNGTDKPLNIGGMIGFVCPL